MQQPTIRTLGQRCITAPTPREVIENLTTFAYFFTKLKHEWCQMDNALGFTAQELEELVKLSVRFVFPDILERLLDCFPYESDPRTLVTHIACDDTVQIILDRFDDDVDATASQCVRMSKLLEHRGPLVDAAYMPTCDKLCEWPKN